MLRSSQQACRRVVARPIGRPRLHETASSRRGRATIQSRLRPSRAFLPQNPQPRYFTTSHPRLAQPPKPSLQEQASTTPLAANIYPHYVPPPPPPPPPPKPKRSRRGFIYAALFLFLGTATGSLFRIAIAPLALPTAGSEQDIYRQTRIQAKGAALPVVQRLSADPAWTSWDASAAQSRLASGPMSGSSGLAFQRVFHNAATGEVVTVVYFGAGLASWPGVVHGGALATVLDESLGRCAILRFPGRTGVTAHLAMQYRTPTLTNNFYVVRATPLPSLEDDLVGADGVRKGDRKLWVYGTLETESGNAAVHARGLFVVPKAYKLRPLVEEF
ncbi:hypothetical protein ANO14919_128310 [Xylariales sp. No.14919]|nr:hypothetical protein ANO14919_128310 [Xylariales sp. No.14919]